MHDFPSQASGKQGYITWMNLWSGTGWEQSAMAAPEQLTVLTLAVPPLAWFAAHGPSL